MSSVRKRRLCEFGFFPQVKCIRAEVHSKFNCLDENINLDMEYGGDTNGLISWPTIRCRIGASKSCEQKNGIEVRVDYLLDTYECHCKPGHFGTYGDNADGTTLIRCNFCPKYGTSIKGTRDIQGCYCRAGTYEVPQILAPGQTIIPNLVCRSCPSLEQYCPGGPAGRSIWAFVFDTVVKVEVQEIMVIDTGVPLDCPANTSTRHRFASSIASCIANINMHYDVALGYWIFCDESVYDSPYITEWLEPTSQSCNRECQAPSSILQLETGNCRCDISKGYGLKVYTTDLEAQCVCQPGWYQFDGDSECIPCPKNSYCDGTTRQLCSVQFATPMYATNETDCVCLPGFYFLDYKQSCKFCQTGEKCPGGRLLDTRLPCSPEEECLTTGIYIPQSCPRGTTKRNLFQRINNDLCSSNGIVNKNIADSLYSNAIQKEGLLYGVDNVILSNACFDITFQINLGKVLNQEWPMPVVGFFGAFQWLCGPGRVLVRNMHVDTTEIAMSDTNVLHAAFLCATPTFASENHNHFLVHGGLAVLSWTQMGVDGFISSSYHDTSISLLDADDHLVWNVFLKCNFPHDYGGVPGVSEIDTCLLCDVRSGGGFLVLGICVYLDVWLQLCCIYFCWCIMFVFVRIILTESRLNGIQHQSSSMTPLEKNFSPTM